MEIVRIILLALAAAIGFGIVHDQVTARVCVEYFTIGHPPLIPTNDPTLLALAWGVVATWWVGLPLGILLAVASRAGSRPKRTAKDLVRPLLLLLAVMFAGALIAGLLGGTLAAAGQVWLLEPMASLVPRDRQVPLLADLWSHTSSYITGTVGGCFLAWWTYRQRSRDSYVVSAGTVPARR